MTQRLTFRELVTILNLINQYKECMDPTEAFTLDYIEEKLNKIYDNLKKQGNYINDLIVVESKTKCL